MSFCRSKKKNAGTRDKVIRTVLTIIAVAGIIGVALVVPNALQALARLGLVPKGRGTYKRYYVNKAFQKLTDRRLIVVHKNRYGKENVCLTKKGLDVLAKYQIKEAVPKIPKQWDGKWRVVVFDIREQKRDLRASIRASLKDFGFVFMQQSVWIFPYPCDEFVSLLKLSFHLRNAIRYMVVEELDDDVFFRKFFRLPRI